MNYGLQLYSVRDSAKENLLETIEKVAAQGYKCLEFAGFFDFSAIFNLTKWLYSVIV